MIDSAPAQAAPEALQPPPPPRTPASTAVIHAAGSLLAVVLAVLAARHFAWVSDDAFISFRYAQNLVEGRGLVFNVGERVEGYTNLLWTLWLAVASAASIDLERWSVVWGIIFHAGTVALLCWNARPGSRRGLVVPAAALVLAAHRDVAIFATSGLETALFTFLAVAGYLIACRAERPRAWAAAAVLFGLATLCRPDGVVLFGAVWLWAVALRRPGVRAVLALSAPFAAIAGALTLWRWAYYGDVLPNTYYAKSAELAWWEQGFFYLGLYARQYGVAVGAGALGLALAVRDRLRDRSPGRASDPVILAGLMVIAYALAVARAGGDFMHARLLVPVTPLLLVCGESVLERLAGGRVRLAQVAKTAAVAATVAFWPVPVTGSAGLRGIVDERDFYVNVAPGAGEGRRALGEALRPLIEGLPVTIAFVGTEARAIYYARPQAAIECETGLTDRWIARQKVTTRGRPGHEKWAPNSYILDTRHSTLALRVLGTQPSIPTITFPCGGIQCQLLRWDPSIVAALRARGAVIPDFPAQVDVLLANASRLSPWDLRANYERVSRFYLEPAADRERDARFKELLARAEAPSR